MTERARVLRHDDRLQSVIPGQFEFKHLHGQGCSVALYRMRSAADIPTRLNCHEEEGTIMLSGQCRLRIDGEDIILRAGDTILIPAFKEHLGELLTDEVVLVSAFVPRREEFGPQSDQAPKSGWLMPRVRLPRAPRGQSPVAAGAP